MSTVKVEREIGGRTVVFSNPDKVLFPQDGLTKSDLVGYYEQVADAMVPHTAGRPVTLDRYPDGIDGKSFFQKQASKHFPDWIPRVEVEKSGGVVQHPLVDEPAALVYLAGQAAITFHVWLAPADQADHPDRLVFDLDPAEDDFTIVRAAAHAVADVLDDLGLARYLQTTGSRGLHVVVPLDGQATLEEVRAFAEGVASVVAAAEPERFTTEFRKDKRAGRLFLDVLRNGYAQTMAAPYTVRPRPGAPVATPIEWDELDDDGLDAQRFTSTTVPDRLRAHGDPWKAMNRHARSLREPGRKLARLLDE